MDSSSTLKTIGLGIFWTNFFNILTKVFAFFSSVLILSHLSLAEYGLSELIISIVAISGIFMLPGLNQTIIADVAVEVGNNNLPKAKKIFKDYLTLRNILSFSVFIVFLAGSFFVENWFTSNVINSIRIYALTFLLAPIRSSISIIFSVAKNFFLQGFLLFSEEFFRFFFIYYFFNFSDLRLEGVFWALFLGQLLSTFSVFMAYRKIVKILGNQIAEGKRFDFIKIMLEHGKWATLSSYFNSFGQNIRIWVIKLILGTEAVGVFSFAYTLMSHVLSLFNISSVVTPILSESVSDQSRFNKILSKSLKYQLLVYFIIMLLSFILAELFVDLFFPNYLSSLPIFYIMLLALPVIGVAAVINILFFIYKAQKQLFDAIFLKNLSALVCSFIGIYFMGILGTGIEYVISAVVFIIARSSLIMKERSGLSFSLKDIFSFDDTDRMLLRLLRRKVLKINL